MSDYPEDSAEYPEGTYYWCMRSGGVMAIRSPELLINQVEYNGVATIRRGKDKQFDVRYGDIYFVREHDILKDPTQAAYSKFFDRVVEIAREVDTDELREKTKIAELREELNGCSGKVIELREGIEEQEDRIVEIESELAQLGGV